MSTTRYGAGNTRANTGAQYLSTSSPGTAALLRTVCGTPSPGTTAPPCPIDRAEDPVTRSTHFAPDPGDGAYTHWLPRGGTNAAVKQFLRAGEPDTVLFQSRLQHVTVIDPTATAPKQLVPLFDSGGAASTYDIVVLAMPPRDGIKFFNGDRTDSRSQADLHRRTNKGRKRPAPLAPDQRSVVLPPDVVRRLRAPSYVGRYSLALWLDDGGGFADSVQEAFRAHGPHPVLDMVSSQEGGRVLVAQSTVELWRRHTNSRNGRNASKSSIVDALRSLAGGKKMPRAQNTKLLNWRTSQVNVNPPTTAAGEGGGGGIVTAEEGRLIFTGDWCYESSFEGCNLAAEAAANAAIETIVCWG